MFPPHTDGAKPHEPLISRHVFNVWASMEASLPGVITLVGLLIDQARKARNGISIEKASLRNTGPGCCHRRWRFRILDPNARAQTNHQIIAGIRSRQTNPQAASCVNTGAQTPSVMQQRA